MKEPALPEGTDEDIIVAIVVVVADRDTQSEYGDGESSFAGHVGESTVAVVVIELERGNGALVARPVFAIHDQDIGIAVVVIINKGTAWAHSFWKPFLAERAIVVDEVNAGLSGNVAELNLLGAGEAD